MKCSPLGEMLYGGHMKKSIALGDNIMKHIKYLAIGIIAISSTVGVIGLTILLAMFLYTYPVVLCTFLILALCYMLGKWLADEVFSIT